MAQPPVPPSDPSRAHARSPDDALSLLREASSLLPLPEGFVPAVMAGLPARLARSKASALPALVRIAAAVLLAIGVSLALQGLSPTVARAEAPALLRHTFAPVLRAVERPALDGAASLAVLPAAQAAPGEPARAARAALVVGVAGLGLALLAGGLFLARRTLTRPAPRPDSPEVRP